jgi:hypothetical protein
MTARPHSAHSVRSIGGGGAAGGGGALGATRPSQARGSQAIRPRSPTTMRVVTITVGGRAVLQQNPAIAVAIGRATTAPRVARRWVMSRTAATNCMAPTNR